MGNKIVSVLLFSTLCWSTAAWPAGLMKAGLWEISVKSDMMKNMPQIPPEQMEKMRQMGVNVPQMQDGAMVTKICVSQAMAERDQPPQPQMHQAGSDCQPKNFQRSGNEYSMDIVCSGANMQGQGTAKGKHPTAESFTSSYQFKGSAHGHPVDTHTESSGKWLSADCGSIKPFDAAMKAQ